MDRKIFISLVVSNFLAFSAWAALYSIDNFEGTLSGWSGASQEKYDTDNNPEAITADATDGSLRINNAVAAIKSFPGNGADWKDYDSGNDFIGFWFYCSEGTTNLVIEVTEEDGFCDTNTIPPTYWRTNETWSANLPISGMNTWSFERVNIDTNTFTRVGTAGDGKLIENLDVETKTDDPANPPHNGVISLSLTGGPTAGATNYVDYIVLTNPGGGRILATYPDPKKKRYEDFTLRCSPPTFSAILGGAALNLETSSIRIVALPKYGYADDDPNRPGGEGLLNNCNQPILVGIPNDLRVTTSNITANVSSQNTIFATLDPDESFKLGKTYVAFIVPRDTSDNVGDAEAVYFTLKGEDSTVPMRTDYYRVYHGELPEEEESE